MICCSSSSLGSGTYPWQWVQPMEWFCHSKWLYTRIYIYIHTHTLILSLYIYLYIHSCGSQGNFDPDLYPFWLLTATVPFCFRPFGRTRWAVRWPDAALHGGDQNQWAFWWTRQLLNLRPSNKANSLKHIYGLVYTYGSQIFHNWSIWSQSWSPFMDIYIHTQYIYICIYLVGGWPTPLKNMKVRWNDSSQYMGK